MCILHFPLLGEVSGWSRIGRMGPWWGMLWPIRTTIHTIIRNHLLFLRYMSSQPHTQKNSITGIFARIPRTTPKGWLRLVPSQHPPGLTCDVCLLPQINTAEAKPDHFICFRANCADSKTGIEEMFLPSEATIPSFTKLKQLKIPG